MSNDFKHYKDLIFEEKLQQHENKKLYEKEYLQQMENYSYNDIFFEKNSIEKIKKESYGFAKRRLTWERTSAGDWQLRERYFGDDDYKILEHISEKEYFHRKLAGTL